MTVMKNLCCVLLTVSFFGGCTKVEPERVEKIFQTNSASSMKKDYKEISKQLIVLKDKLDKRNPNAYNRTISNSIYTNIGNLTNGVSLKFNHVPLNTYKDYLQIAFSKLNIQNRNDFLILGLYKEMYNAYDVKEGHQVTALSYDKKKLENLYQNLQIIKWKMSNDKDANGDYLFLTWQNNWQIELERALKQNNIKTYEDIMNLHSLKDGHETLFSQSNTSFEVVLTSMIARVKRSLETVGGEPIDVGLEALTIFIFL